MEIAFNPIDLNNWPRVQMFNYFSSMAPTGYSLTVELDITILKKYLKEHELKFFPTYLWLVTKMLNKQIEFKVANFNDTIGYWNTLTPMYACFHDDDKTISLMWTEYDDDFSIFYNRYLENQNQYGNNHGLLSQPDTMPPANCYTVSCVPWIEFSHFAIHSFENKSYYFPSIEAGKFNEKNGRIKLPFSITAHHATTDGYHIKVFVEDLQSAMNNPKDWLKKNM